MSITREPRIIEVVKRGQKGQDGNPGLTNAVAVAVNTTLTESHKASLIRATDAVTLSFDPASSLGDGWSCMVDASNGDVTLDPTEPINGGDTVVIPDSFGAFVYVSGDAFYVRYMASPNGVPSLKVQPGTDFNALTTEGEYYCASDVDMATMTNAPLAEAGSLSVRKGSGVTQVFHTTGADHKIYSRTYDNTTWTAWELHLFKATDFTGQVKVNEDAPTGYVSLRRNNAGAPTLFVTQAGSGPIAKFRTGDAGNETDRVVVTQDGTLKTEGAVEAQGVVEAGLSGGGSVALTVNDGGGNSNVTFNHRAESPDQAGNAGRISVNTDSASDAKMTFSLKTNVTAGVAVAADALLELTTSGLFFNNGQIDHAGRNAGAVGSYAFLCPVSSNNSYAQNDTASGSALDYSAATAKSTASPSGTWKCMGYSHDGSSVSNRSTLWKRIS